MMTRRNFLGASLATLALGPAILSGCVTTTGQLAPVPNQAGGRPPNILLVLVDEYRRSPDYPDGTGAAQGLRELLNFDPLTPNNPFVQYFPGFMRLRQNSVVLRTHYIASAACVPSRATMLTGQYPTVHGVSQTTGFFKSPSDADYVFLDPDGIPTVGDWFQAAGYETYYFGKWHVSETCDDLGPWGFPFAAWDGPEPHGSDPANLGVFRDPEFANDTVGFLNSRGDGDAPWFAVTSYVSPHDISGWPLQWFLPLDMGVQPAILPGVVPPIPGPNEMSLPVMPLSMTDCPPPASDPVNLNPGGYPAGAFNSPPTFGEDLSTKPDCHFDMSYKIGLCQKAQVPLPLHPITPNPFQLDPKFEEWTRAYGEWGLYLHHLFDQKVAQVLQALDDNGLRENTIVIFTCDHGDYGGAHGGCIQKWHTAYEEATRVPLVVSSPLVNSGDEMKEVTMPTSHIDLLPTLLGLAGFGPAAQAELKARITGQGVVPDLVGHDLAPHVLNPGGPPIDRPGVLFMTDDEISQLSSPSPDNEKFPQFLIYLDLVEKARLTVPELAPGVIRQPNLVRTLADGVWKYSRYFDPNGVEPDQYELYHLPSDPSEAVNLVDYQTNAIRNGVGVPGLSTAELEAKKDELAQQLAAQEAALL